MLSLVLCAAVAAGDAAAGPHLILIDLLAAGPPGGCRPPQPGALAITLAVMLGIPDQIFATPVQYAFLAAVTTVTILQQHHP